MPKRILVVDDEANIAPWLRAAHRYGAKVKWAEIDIETGELPTWQWESLIGKSTQTVRITNWGASRVVADVGTAGFALGLHGRPRVVRRGASVRSGSAPAAT